MTEGYSFSSDYVDIFLRDGIVWVVYGHNARITSDKALIIVGERLKVSQGRPHPTIADCRKGTSIDKASRAIFAGPDAMKNVIAGALLFNNPIHRMFIHAYLWFDNPSIPTAVFTSEIKALEWLQLYKYSVN